MTIQEKEPVNKVYIILVSALTFVLPLLSWGLEKWATHSAFSLPALGKWFIFYAVGCRLLAAGIRQISKPAFTAKAIFRLEGAESYPVIRELGFANLCAGLVGILCLFLPQWRPVSAFSSGLYYGLAGALHLARKGGGINEQFALYTDFFIFVALAAIFLTLY